jgi:hypothetical protein
VPQDPSGHGACLQERDEPQPPATPRTAIRAAVVRFDIPVTVYAALEVGEEIKYGTLLSLYRLNAVKIEFRG